MEKFLWLFHLIQLQFGNTNVYDIWEAQFGYMGYKFNIVDMNSILFDGINDDINSIKKFLQTDISEFYASNAKFYDDFYEMLEVLLSSYLNRVFKKEYDLYSKDLYKTNLYDVLNKTLTPENLNMKISNYNKLSDSSTEVWIDKPAILIDFNKVKKLNP